MYLTAKTQGKLGPAALVHVVGLTFVGDGSPAFTTLAIERQKAVSEEAAFCRSAVRPYITSRRVLQPG